MARSDFFDYMHDSAEVFRFCLHGDLSGDNTDELAQARRTAGSVMGKRRLVVDLTAVRGIDQQGRELLATWRDEGARLVAAGATSKIRAEQFTGGPVELAFEHRKAPLLLLVAAATAVLPAATACVVALAAPL